MEKLELETMTPFKQNVKQEDERSNSAFLDQETYQSLGMIALKNDGVEHPDKEKTIRLEKKIKQEDEPISNSNFNEQETCKNFCMVMLKSEAIDHYEQESTTPVKQKIKQEDEPTNGSIPSGIKKKPRLTSAEKMRAFRRRQREKQMTENLSVSMVSRDRYGNSVSERLSVGPTTSTGDSPTTTTKKRPLTSAEKVRAYRQRQREKRMAANLSIFKVSQENCENSNSELLGDRRTISTGSSMTKKNAPLTPAERMRAYRRRRRDKRLTENSSIFEVLRDNFKNNDFQQLDDRPSTSTDTFTIKKRPRLTNAERLTACPERQCKGEIENNSSVATPLRNDSERDASNNKPANINEAVNDPGPSNSRIPETNCGTTANQLPYSDLDSHENFARIMFEKRLKNCTFVLFSETWPNNGEKIDIENFNCIVQYKRPNSRADGVAVYHSSEDTTRIVTPSHDIALRLSSQVSATSSEIGDICAVRCTNSNNEALIIVTIYISPEKTVNNIIEFINETLLPYTIRGSAILKKNDHQIPMIMVGDFNVDFSLYESQPIIDFLNDEFNLRINNSTFESRTGHGPTIDAAFSRNLQQLESKIYVSYFSYHKPIVSFLNNDKPSEESN